jgi:hypothetical protein
MTSSSTVCRTAVVLTFLVVVVLAGRSGCGTTVACLGLVAVWLAPLLVVHRRHRGVHTALAAPPREA